MSEWDEMVMTLAVTQLARWGDGLMWDDLTEYEQSIMLRDAGADLRAALEGLPQAADELDREWRNAGGDTDFVIWSWRKKNMVVVPTGGNGEIN